MNGPDWPFRGIRKPTSQLRQNSMLLSSPWPVRTRMVSKRARVTGRLQPQAAKPEVGPAAQADFLR